MKMKWAALAAVTAMAAVPTMAQSNMTTMGTTTSMNMKNVDEASVRSDLDQLRGYLDRMRENNRLMAASGDVVAADGYRRNNAVLLDNATALSMHLSKELGEPSTVPNGWGVVRAWVSDIRSDLAGARLRGDYTHAVTHARKALDRIEDHLHRSNTGMSGSMGTNMNH